MNGGCCTLHFMPYQDGTAVDARYSIVQLFGARYEANNDYLIDFVVSILRIRPTKANIPIETFLCSKNNVAISSQTSNQNYKEKYCSNCGNPVNSRDSFCSNCGKPLR